MTKPYWRKVWDCEAGGGAFVTILMGFTVGVLFVAPVLPLCR